MSKKIKKVNYRKEFVDAIGGSSKRDDVYYTDLNEKEYKLKFDKVHKALKEKYSNITLVEDDPQNWTGYNTKHKWLKLKLSNYLTVKVNNFSRFGAIKRQYLSSSGFDNALFVHFCLRNHKGQSQDFVMFLDESKSVDDILLAIEKFDKYGQWRVAESAKKYKVNQIQFGLAYKPQLEAVIKKELGDDYSVVYKESCNEFNVIRDRILIISFTIRKGNHEEDFKTAMKNVVAACKAREIMKLKFFRFNVW